MKNFCLFNFLNGVAKGDGTFSRTLHCTLSQNKDNRQTDRLTDRQTDYLAVKFYVEIPIVFGHVRIAAPFGYAVVATIFG